MSDAFGVQTVSDPIPVPFAVGTWIQVRKLTGRECEAAAVAHQSSVASGGPRAWPRVLRRALEHGASDPEVRAALQDPLLGYDRYVLAASGLVAWNGPAPLEAVLEASAGWTAKQVREAHYAVRQEAVEGLAEEEVDFIATEVLRRTKPALFVGAEVAQKNA